MTKAVSAHSTAALSAPAVWMAGMRELDAEFWLIQDNRTGAIELRGTISVCYPEGVAPSEYHARMDRLDAIKNATPDMRSLLIEELKREGRLYTFPAA